MKSVFIAGSRKFFSEIENLVRMCRDSGIHALTAGKLNDCEDMAESEGSALLRAFERMDASDVVFVFAGDGYVGKTTAMEIAYAFSRGKEIISSERVEDLSARSLVARVMKPSELVEYMRG